MAVEVFFLQRYKNNVLFLSHRNTTIPLAFSLWVKKMKHFNYLLAFNYNNIFACVTLKKII